MAATLIEADARNAERAANHITRLGFSNIEVRRTDAGTSNAYLGAAPADLLLLCGIFGNITDDVHRTIAAAPQLCKQNTVVIWTRNPQDPDLTQRIRGGRRPSQTMLTPQGWTAAELRKGPYVVAFSVSRICAAIASAAAKSPRRAPCQSSTGNQETSAGVPGHRGMRWTWR